MKLTTVFIGILCSQTTHAELAEQPSDKTTVKKNISPPRGKTKRAQAFYNMWNAPDAIYVGDLKPGESRKGFTMKSITYANNTKTIHGVIDREGDERLLRDLGECYGRTFSHCTRNDNDDLFDTKTHGRAYGWSGQTELSERNAQADTGLNMEMKSWCASSFMRRRRTLFSIARDTVYSTTWTADYPTRGQRSSFELIWDLSCRLRIMP